MTTQLDEDRLSRMRSTVMAAVETDTRRRGRRARTVVGVGAAVAVLAGVGGVGTALTTQGGVVSASSGDDSGLDASSVESTAGGSEDSASRLSAAADSAGGDADSAGGDAKAVAPEDADREVIVTGSASLTAKDPAAVSARIASWVEARQGRVDARTTDDSGDGVYASLTVRVPSAQVTATLDHLESYGDVSNVSVANDDVTGVARDLDARIKALRISIDRLEKILADAGSSAEVVRAEDALTGRQEQLEQLQSQRTRMSEQVSLATLTIDVSQTASTGSVDPGGFRGGLVNGWNALVDVVNRAVEGLGVALPWAGVLLAIYAVYRGSRVLARRRS